MDTEGGTPPPPSSTAWLSFTRAKEFGLHVSAPQPHTHRRKDPQSKKQSFLSPPPARPRTSILEPLKLLDLCQKMRESRTFCTDEPVAPIFVSRAPSATSLQVFGFGELVNLLSVLDIFATFCFVAFALDVAFLLLRLHIAFCRFGGYAHAPPPHTNPETVGSPPNTRHSIVLLLAQTLAALRVFNADRLK